MASHGESSPPAPEAMARLAQVIGDRSKHADLISDAESALRKAGITRGELPDEIFDALSALDEEQLAVVADASEKLVQHGFRIETPGGTVCYL